MAYYDFKKKPALTTKEGTGNVEYQERAVRKAPGLDSEN